jgi:hypothetical protein
MPFAGQFGGRRFLAHKPKPRIFDNFCCAEREPLVFNTDVKNRPGSCDR